MGKLVRPIRSPRQETSAAPAPITLADITVTWQEGGRTHYVNGHTLARLVLTARQRNPYSEGHDAGGESLRITPMLRGLGALAFPDAGEPVSDLDKDRRFFVSEVLADMAAALDVDALMHADCATEFRVHVGKPPAVVRAAAARRRVRHVRAARAQGDPLMADAPVGRRRPSKTAWIARPVPRDPREAIGFRLTRADRTMFRVLSDVLGAERELRDLTSTPTPALARDWARQYRVLARMLQTVARAVDGGHRDLRWRQRPGRQEARDWLRRQLEGLQGSER